MVAKKRPGPKKKPGRKPVITEQIIKRVLYYVKKGLSQRKACEAVGVKWRTWMQYKKNHDNVADRLERAKAEYHSRLVETAYDRAVDGYEEVHTDETGEVKKRIRKQDNDLLFKLLKAEDPQKFDRARQLEINQRVSIEGQARSKLASKLGLTIEAEKVDAIEEADYEELPTPYSEEG